VKQGIKNFFKYARARHAIYHKKQDLWPQPWTKDPILQKYRFTNVFRELDRTTIWFADNVREPLRDKPEVLLATVLFRMLNRIETGEAIFLHDNLIAESSAFYELVRAKTPKQIHTAIKNIERAVIAFRGVKGPHVTGAYIISSPPGYTKMQGILMQVEKFCVQSGWLMHAQEGMRDPGKYKLEHVWNYLKQFDYFGPFHSYEMVTDLRFTALLENAPDIMTWANPGPGANRGANRVFGRPFDTKNKREALIEEMRMLLSLSEDSDLWPQEKMNTKKLWKYDHKWPTWEMRDVEHTLCEFDKYERVRLGEGRPRGVYS
jgi:hypothetical protein